MVNTAIWRTAAVLSLLSFLPRLVLSGAIPETLERRQSTESFTVTFDRDTSPGRIPTGNYENSGFDFSDFSTVDFKEPSQPGSRIARIQDLKGNFLRPNTSPRYALRAAARTQETLSTFPVTGFRPVQGSGITTFRLSQLSFGCVVSSPITAGDVNLNAEILRSNAVPVNCILRIRGVKRILGFLETEGVYMDNFFAARTPIDAETELGTIQISEMETITFGDAWSDLLSVSFEIQSVAVSAGTDNGITGPLTGILTGGAVGGAPRLVIGIAIDTVRGTKIVAPAGGA